MSQRSVADVMLHLRRDWARISDTYAVGAAFRDGSHFPAEELAARFSELDTVDAVESALRTFNGFFSIITETDRGILLSTDRIASFPLFYSIDDGDAYVSDDPSWVRTQVNDTTFDEIGELEYLLSGYVTGRKTLSPNVSQLLCGERLLVGDDSDDDSFARTRWYEFPQPNEQVSRSDAELLSEFDSVLERVYSRLIEYADGRPIVVSLSSGHDSRLNLIMLSKLGYDNLIALTHGEGEGEAELCQYIAEDFGVPWVYVSKTHDEWFRWYNSQEREKFQSDCRYLDRVPTLEGALSVRTARNQGLIPDDSVFVTGDGVISTGEHIPPKFVDDGSVSAESVFETIVQSHYKYWDWDEAVEAVLTEQVASGLDHPTVSSTADAVEVMERWDWQERQAKFIPRKHIFEFWDYDWWMPLWDDEFVDFWCRLPVEAKFDKQLFRQYVEQQYAAVADVDETRVQETLWQGRSLGQKLKHTLRNSRFDPVGTRFDKLARQVYFSFVSPTTYESNPMFGIMKEAQFEELQTGLLPIVHSFQALEVLDRVSFDPPQSMDVPEGSSVSMDDVR